ncbi:MAG TPA: GIY-YIG nuclease family protein [Treponemataceae bacterium]|nr:GIY-YIG nuclease family protein [Treponemataceae bacterium]
MAEKRSKKELLRAFKAEREVGGVYAIKNRETGRALIQTTTTISKAKGILSFAKLTGSCVHPLIADDWKAYGPDAFELEILETLDRKDEESDAEFAEEVRALGELWSERFPAETRY